MNPYYLTGILLVWKYLPYVNYINKSRKNRKKEKDLENESKSNFKN